MPVKKQIWHKELNHLHFSLAVDWVFFKDAFLQIRKQTVTLKEITSLSHLFSIYWSFKMNADTNSISVN